MTDVLDETTDEQVGQIKKRVKVDDFSLDDVPFDVRLGVSTEEPFEYDGEETSTKQTTKERWSFVRKNLSIDMTIVKGAPDDKDSDEDTFYQIEMEIIDPKALEGEKDTFNLLEPDLLELFVKACALETGPRVRVVRTGRQAEVRECVI
jgi:hypothetical protein